MPRITSITGRILYNSRGSKTIEVDVISDEKYLGRVCAPSGASVGKHEAQSFPQDKPEKSIDILQKNKKKFIGLDSSDLKTIHETLRDIDQTPNYSKIGGSLAFALTIAATESAARALETPMFQILSKDSTFRYPLPLGNILGGGAHAGPGTPDIQEILVCATGSKNIQDAIETNLSIHKEVGKILAKRDPSFTNGRGDEGGWAPKLKNDEALEISAKACEQLGFTLGKEVSLGVDFASSTQWNEKKKKYVYNRAGFENTPEEQIEFASSIIKKYKLVYAEDAVHEEAFNDMSVLTKRFPRVLITGDDLLVTNTQILKKAIKIKACNGAILKVNQAGSLYDALEFAKEANKNNVRLITSHRSGESIDSHISHIGLATKSKMLKVGIIGGERIAKLNELVRLSEYDLIRGMAEI
ncbi:Enolase [Nitrosotalea sinensis]|uniref:Enolase n=1 Tax=Nitrosotalea sinensis TaxID=1499975 RepID=A0A2H1EEQ6_9ARCH|nr:enolase [Candidatus Nitrosotalea sinensis]SHO42566.1 Enolase [Candidatus Nitrosotalea sinensis]